MFVRFERLQKPNSFNDSPITSLSWMRHDPVEHPSAANSQQQPTQSSNANSNSNSNSNSVPQQQQAGAAAPAGNGTVQHQHQDNQQDSSWFQPVAQLDYNNNSSSSNNANSNNPHNPILHEAQSSFDSSSLNDPASNESNKTDGWLAVGNYRGTVGVSFTTINLEHYGRCYNSDDDDNEAGFSDSKRFQPHSFSGSQQPGAAPIRTNYNLRGHRSEIIFVRWNEPYQKLATCDRNGVIFVWIKYEGRWSIELINDRNTKVTDFAWSHDGRMALICYMDGFVLVGSVSGQRYWSSMLNLNDCSITCGTWTANDQQVLFGTSNGHILVISVHGAFITQVSVQECVEISTMIWSCRKFTSPSLTNGNKSATSLYPAMSSTEPGPTGANPQSHAHFHHLHQHHHHHHHHHHNHQSHQQHHNHQQYSTSNWTSTSSSSSSATSISNNTSGFYSNSNTTSPLLAVSFVDGSIYLMQNYDDIFPIIIHTDLIDARLEWSSDGQWLAVGGHRMTRASKGASTNGMLGGYVYTNVINFYSTYGTLKRSIVLNFNRQPLSAISWGNDDQRIYVACGQVLFVGWIIASIPSLNFLSRLKVYQCLTKQEDVCTLPVPDAIMSSIHNLFSQTVHCYLPDYRHLRKFVLRPPQNNARLYCTLMRHDEDQQQHGQVSSTVSSSSSSSANGNTPASATNTSAATVTESTTYILYLEYLGGLVPILKGKRSSKLKPEFVIYDPESSPTNSNSQHHRHHHHHTSDNHLQQQPSKCASSASPVSQPRQHDRSHRHHHHHQHHHSSSPSPASLPLATSDSENEYDSSSSTFTSSFPYLTPKTRRRLRNRSLQLGRHFGQRNQQASAVPPPQHQHAIATTTDHNNNNTSSFGITPFIDEMPETNKIVLITSNIWGTKFKFLGLSPMLPAFLGSITYRTSLLHLQPRQMALVIKELNNKNTLTNVDSAGVCKPVRTPYYPITPVSLSTASHNNVSSDSEDEYSGYPYSELFKTSTCSNSALTTPASTIIGSVASGSNYDGTSCGNTPAIVPLTPFKSLRNLMLVNSVAQVHHPPAQQQQQQQQSEPTSSLSTSASTSSQLQQQSQSTRQQLESIISAECSSIANRLAQMNNSNDDFMTLQIDQNNNGPDGQSITYSLEISGNSSSGAAEAGASGVKLNFKSSNNKKSKQTFGSEESSPTPGNCNNSADVSAVDSTVVSPVLMPIIPSSTLVRQFKHQTFQSESPKHVSQQSHHLRQSYIVRTSSNPKLNSPNNSPNKNIRNKILKESPRKSSVSYCSSEFNSTKSYIDNSATSSDGTEQSASTVATVASTVTEVTAQKLCDIDNESSSVTVTAEAIGTAAAATKVAKFISCSQEAFIHSGSGGSFVGTLNSGTNGSYIGAAKSDPIGAASACGNYCHGRRHRHNQRSGKESLDRESKISQNFELKSGKTDKSVHHSLLNLSSNENSTPTASSGQTLRDQFDVDKMKQSHFQTYHIYDDTMLLHGTSNTLNLQQQQPIINNSQLQTAQNRRLAFKNNSTKQSKSLESTITTAQPPILNKFVCNNEDNINAQQVDLMNNNNINDEHLTNIEQVVKLLTEKLQTQTQNNIPETGDQLNSQNNSFKSKNSASNTLFSRNLLKSKSSKNKFHSPSSSSIVSLNSSDNIVEIVGDINSAQSCSRLESTVEVSTFSSNSNNNHSNLPIQLHHKSLPASPALTRHKQTSKLFRKKWSQEQTENDRSLSPITKAKVSSFFHSPNVIRKMRRKLSYLDCSSEDDNNSSDDDGDLEGSAPIDRYRYNNSSSKQQRSRSVCGSDNIEFQQQRQKQTRETQSGNVSDGNVSAKKAAYKSAHKSHKHRHHQRHSSIGQEFQLQNKAPLWNEISQVYQLDFGGRVTQESAKNFQIEYQGRQVMQFGRIDTNAYTLDFEYPFSVVQALAVALANVTQRLK